MMERTGAGVAPSPIAVFERRFQWPATPALTFLGVLGLLFTAGLVPRLVSPPAASGLPGDPNVLAAAELLRGSVSFPTEGLRFESSLYGAVPAPARPAHDLESRLDRAERMLDAAPRRARADARWHIARGAVDLARHRFRRAARRYERALAGSGDYPEARLGLGVALALSARFERHPLTQRRTTLRAIAQFAAVKPGAVQYEQALFNRVMLLDRAGRGAEAARFAVAYLDRDGSSAWADRVRDVARRNAS